MFDDNSLSTIGAAFCTKTEKLGGTNYRLNIWDTAGQEKYRALATMYYRGAECAIVAYCVDNRDSLEQADQYWIQEIKRECFEDMLIVVVGNKCDLTKQRVVSVEEGQAMAEKHGATYFEVSAKAGTNITELFKSVVEMLPECVSRKNSDAARLNSIDDTKKKKGKCAC
jgi:Ras-related protein Rab-5C